MSYQAVIRNSGGELVKSSNVGLQISILEGSETGTEVFVETFNKTTNENGMLTLEIGEGTPVSGSMSGINWSAGVYFFKTETDLTGGTNYTIEGTSQLLSVPYALYANNADSAVKYSETDPVFNSSAASEISNDDINNWNANMLPAISEEGNLLTFDGNNWVAKDLLLVTGYTGSDVPINNMQPSLVLNYCIALWGIYPTRNGIDPFVGEIGLFGNNFPPMGWATCVGQLLAITQNTALFSLLGTFYGGDGRTTFALPDLRGRVPLHRGNGPGLSGRQLGEKTGTETTTINVTNLPAHNHNVKISFVD
jgi:microcystin-dependent protein